MPKIPPLCAWVDVGCPNIDPPEGCVVDAPKLKGFCSGGFDRPNKFDVPVPVPVVDVPKLKGFGCCVEVFDWDVLPKRDIMGLEAAQLPAPVSGIQRPELRQ